MSEQLYLAIGIGALKEVIVNLATSSKSCAISVPLCVNSYVLGIFNAKTSFLSLSLRRYL